MDTEAFAQDGWAIAPGVLDAASQHRLRDAFAAAADPSATSQRNGSTYGRRNVLDLPAVGDVLRLPAVRELVHAVLGPDAFAVRGLFFDKTPGANWHVPAHQDISVAVREKIALPPAAPAEGFGAWSHKAGVVHVQPPASVLAGMLALRLHLDDCPAANGALRVYPGSHREGKLSPSQVRAWQNTTAPLVCPARSGDALLLRPLLLHASLASGPAFVHRRVLHIEWAAAPLPYGLRWQTAGEKQRG